MVLGQKLAGNHGVDLALKAYREKTDHGDRRALLEAITPDLLRNTPLLCQQQFSRDH